jgi:hexosaminidase
MKQYVIGSLLILAVMKTGFAQKTASLKAADLSINLEMVSRNEGKIQSVLRLKNNGKAELPASGWKIYFNSRVVNTWAKDSTIATIKRVNGDLFCLSPLKAFKTVPAGAELQLQLALESMNNVTERPQGFYLVWDKSPDHGETISKLTYKPFPEHLKEEQELAARVYQRNTGIKEIREGDLPAVFPTPVSYVKQEGFFKLTAAVQLVSAGVFEKEVKGFANELTKILGKTPVVVEASEKGGIFFEQESAMAKEAYELSISSRKIVIKAADAAGAFYAIQSLKTMFPAKAWASVQTAISLPAATVKDAPRFGFRGFMMDVGRNFQPKSEVFKVLDLMALYKLNVFHFHLTEDEGWRLEIPGLPELTSVGAQRGHSEGEQKSILPSYGSAAAAGTNSGSGFFTKADYVEILKYATARHILVIPEIETPGHARAAIKSMDVRYSRLMKAGQKEEAERYLLRDLNDQSKYRSVQGFDDNVVNVALPSTYAFLEKVTDELIAMHKEAGAPLTTIHFGGDEVPAGVWEKSAAADQLSKTDPAVKGTDALWYYYFSKMNQLLKTKGLYLSGWEEIGLRKMEVNGEKKMLPEPRFVNENFHADVWNNLTGNEDLAYKMANAGYKVVLTPVTNFYIDLAVNPSFEERGQNWGGYVDVDKPFYFIPYDYYKNVKEDEQGNPVDLSVFKDKERLTEKGKSNIVGLQAPLWSETIKTPAQLEYMLLPKLLGLAERAWAKDPEWATTTDAAKEKAAYDQAWSEFVNVLGKKELPRLSYYSGGYQYRIPTPGVRIDNGQLEANLQLPGFTIRYTTDGTEPGKNSQIYKTAIPFKGAVKLRAFDGVGRGGRTILIK